jgi:hypothetical protein
MTKIIVYDTILYMNEIKQTPIPQYDNLLNSLTLLNNTTASMIVLFVQETLRSQDKKPEGTGDIIGGSTIANLQVAAYNMLYTIREVNANSMTWQSTPEAMDKSRNIHKELYYYENQITTLLKKYLEKKDNYFKLDYINELEILKKVKPLI